MGGRRSRFARRARGGAVLVLTAVLALAGCQSLGDGGDVGDGGADGAGRGAAPATGPADPADPCAAGSPPIETLVLSDVGDGEPSEEDMAWQLQTEEVVQALIAAAGDRMAALWLSWEPERSIQVRLTEGPEIPEVTAAVEASDLVVEVAYDRAVSEAELLAALRALSGVWADVPGVAGIGVDTLGGRLAVDVAAGDDGGAATCAALAELLADAGVPYGFEVFDGPTESAVRGPVMLTEVYLRGDRTVKMYVASCNGDPEVTVLEEATTEVRVEITSTTAAPGWPSPDCLDGLEVTLDAPLAGRTLIDLTTGDVVDVVDVASSDG